MSPDSLSGWGTSRCWPETAARLPPELRQLMRRYRK